MLEFELVCVEVLVPANGMQALRNDCLPVILALRKRSHSARFQADTETVALGILEAVAKASFLHIPGTEMIAVDTDGASREGAKHVLDPP